MTTAELDYLHADAAMDPTWGVASALFDDRREYRYVLTRIWDRTLPVTAFVMLNPSTADAFTVDPTVRRCLGFAQDWGSGGLIVLNAFALRSTNPRVLYGHPDPTGQHNDDLIRRTLDRYQPAQVVAGWGHHAGKIDEAGFTKRALTNVYYSRRHSWRSRESDLAEMLGDRLMALKVTKDGHPGHPLYLPAEALAQPWSPRG